MDTVILEAVEGSPTMRIKDGSKNYHIAKYPEPYLDIIIPGEVTVPVEGTVAVARRNQRFLSADALLGLWY